MKLLSFKANAGIYIADSYKTNKKTWDVIIASMHQTLH